MGIVAVSVIFLYLITHVLTNDVKCNVTVNITNGVRNGNSITYDGVTYDENDYYFSGDEIKGCVCNKKQCVRKCCLEGEFLNVTSGSCVSLMNTLSTNISMFHIINVPNNQICREGNFKVMIDVDEFSLSDGALIWDDEKYVLEDYCLDNVENSSVAIICVMEDQQVNRLIYSIGMIISMPFLLVTFLVYAILPESNIHRKALMFYVLSLLIAYITLVTIQLHNKQFGDITCPALGYATIFFFMASFFWMNVMCIDMWFAFSGMRGFNGQKNAEQKRFIFYCIYACGMPTLQVLIVFLINHYGDSSTSYHPGIGYEKCFLREDLPNLLYFYGPLAILISINVVLFILTAVKIQKVKKETSMLKHSDSKKHNYEDDKQKFNLYLKLLFAMGINWTMEFISWAVEWQMGKRIPVYVWYLTDFCNAMYGVFIFFIFVFKRKIWKSLEKRYYVFIGKPHMAHSITTTRTTRSSNYSTTETGLSEHRMSDFKHNKPEERALTQN